MMYNVIDKKEICSFGTQKRQENVTNSCPFKSINFIKNYGHSDKKVVRI